MSEWRSPAEVHRVRRRLITVLVVVDVVLALIVSGRFFFRADLTRNAAYTLSTASRDIVDGLPEHLSITYYVSDALRGRSSIPSQIEDLLREYADASHGKLSVASADPGRAGLATLAGSLGVSPRQIQTVNRDQVSLLTVYSGIVLQYLDRTATLPYVEDVATLEYDLSSQIRALEENRPRVIGVLLGDARKSLDHDYRFLQQELHYQFQVREVARGEEVPADIPTLLVIGTHDMDDGAVFMVDQFIMRGGRALIAVDPVDVTASSGIRAGLNAATSMEDALAYYGVRVPGEIVLDTENRAITYTAGNGQTGEMRYPEWVAVSAGNVSAANPITARFSGLDLYWPAPLEVVERRGVTAELLARTSSNAWTMGEAFTTDPSVVATLAAPATGTRSIPLAVALTGSFPSAFAGTASAPTRLIVVGNADFASDMIQLTNADYNMTFLSNCAAWLSRDDDLLAIKTRGQADARLDAVSDPVQKAAIMRRSVALNVILVPLLVIGAGCIRLLRRRRRQRE